MQEQDGARHALPGFRLRAPGRRLVAFASFLLPLSSLLPAAGFNQMAFTGAGSLSLVVIEARRCRLRYLPGPSLCHKSQFSFTA